MDNPKFYLWMGEGGAVASDVKFQRGSFHSGRDIYSFVSLNRIAADVNNSDSFFWVNECCFTKGMLAIYYIYISELSYTFLCA